MPKFKEFPPYGTPVLLDGVMCYLIWPDVELTGSTKVKVAPRVKVIRQVCLTFRKAEARKVAYAMATDEPVEVTDYVSQRWLFERSTCGAGCRCGATVTAIVEGGAVIEHEAEQG